MNQHLVFNAMAHLTKSFDSAAFLCALMAEGAASQPARVTEGLLVKRQQGFGVALPIHVRRIKARLLKQGLIEARSVKTVRTIYSVPASVLDRALDAVGNTSDPSAMAASQRLVRVMHHLEDYDAAVLLCGLLDVPEPEVPKLTVADIVERHCARIDRFRAHRALKRLAARGLLLLEAKPRSGTRIELVQPAVAELLARPLPALRYLSAEVYVSQPYFVERARRLADADAVVQSVTLGATQCTDAGVTDFVSGPVEVL